MAGASLPVPIGVPWTKPQGWTQNDFTAMQRAGFRYGSLGNVTPVAGGTGNTQLVAKDPKLIQESGGIEGWAWEPKPLNQSPTQGNMGWIPMSGLLGNMPGGAGGGGSINIPKPPTLPPMPTGGGGDLGAPPGGGGGGEMLDPQQVAVPPPKLSQPAMGGLMGAMGGPGFAQEKPSGDPVSLGKRIMPDVGQKLTQKGNRVWR